MTGHGAENRGTEPRHLAEVQPATNTLESQCQQWQGTGLLASHNTHGMYTQEGPYAGAHTIGVWSTHVTQTHEAKAHTLDTQAVQQQKHTAQLPQAQHPAASLVVSDTLQHHS
jgi:hypothetical protein